MIDCQKLREFERVPVDQQRELLAAAENDAERLLLLLSLGFTTAPSDVAQAEAYNAQAARLVEGQQDACCTSMLKRNAAHAALYRNDYVTALTLIDEAERLCVHVERCNNGLLDVIRATAYMYMSNYPQSQMMAERALHTAEATGDQRIMTSALSVLGSVAVLADNYTLAISCFERCIPLYEQRGYVRGLGKTQNNLSQTYFKMGQYDKARKAAQQAMRYYAEINDARGAYYSNNTLGLLYIQAADYVTGEHHMREAFRIAGELNDRMSRANACYELARIKRLRGETGPAIAGLQDALAQAEAIEAAYIVRDVHRELAACHEQLGNFEAALAHERAFHEAWEQVSNADVQAKLRQSQLQLEVELARKDAESARRQLAHADRLTSLGRLAAAIAHEINNPLQAIYGGLLLLAEDATGQTLPADTRETLLSTAIESVQRVQQIVTGMREMYQLDVGEVEALNLVDQVNRVLLLMQKSAAMQQVEIETDFPDVLPAVYAVSRHIQQILLNLILNALDAMPEGGILSLRVSVESTSVVLVVEDNGEGMNEQILSQAFTPFFTTRAHGSGLGLSICQNLIRHYGGGIAFDSQPGRGTMAIVRLPVQMREQDGE